MCISQTETGGMRSNIYLLKFAVQHVAIWLPMVMESCKETSEENYVVK